MEFLLPVPGARMLGGKRSSRLFQNVQFHHGFEQTNERGGADGETLPESGTREFGKTGKYIFG